MSSYFDGVECTVCGEAIMGTFLDKSHHFNAVMFASCPKCGCYIFNDQFRELINMVNSIEDKKEGKEWA